MTKYDEAMEHIVLSEEARERILGGIENADLSRNAGPRIINISDAKRIIAAAACLLVVVSAAVLAGVLSGRQEPSIDTGGPMTGTYAPVDYMTCAELSEAMGFAVEDAAALIPGAGNAVYTDLFGETAQITFRAGESDVTYRKALSEEDVSGDYNEYEDVKQISLEGVDVTLKGGADGFALALWQKDGYSCSLQYEPPVTEGPGGDEPGGDEPVDPADDPDDPGDE